MPRPRVVAVAAGAIALIGGGYLAYSQFSGGGADMTRYPNTNINLGAVAEPDTASCGTTPGSARLVCLIDLLKTGASAELLATLQVDYSVAEAKKWSNLPAGAYPDRPGALLGELTVDQQGLVKSILKEAMGLAANEGYDELEQVLNADDYIATVSTDTKAGYSSSNFFVAFLGTPAATGTWQLYYGGHHTAVTVTFKDGALSGATPSFRGIEPFPAFTMNGRENVPLTQERDALAAVLTALTPEQQALATIEGTYADVLAGPQNDDNMATAAEGISVADLTADQQALVIAAIETYVSDINAADAAVLMAKYSAELPQTTLGFAGTPQVNSENDYVRLDGPSLWLEFSLQSNKSTGQDGNHPHSVWRDRTSDYGGNSE